MWVLQYVFVNYKSFPSNMVFYCTSRFFRHTILARIVRVLEYPEIATSYPPYYVTSFRGSCDVGCKFSHNMITMTIVYKLTSSTTLLQLKYVSQKL